MPKRATKVILSEKEQEELTQISKRHRSEQQVALRARMVLAAAQGQSNAQIARELEVNVDPVRLWRDCLGVFPEIEPDNVCDPERLEDTPPSLCPPRNTPRKTRPIAAPSGGA